MDAVVAAPNSHAVLLENEFVRVVEVVIQPGEREPSHTHRWPGVMLIDRPARIRYYGVDGSIVFESPDNEREAESTDSGPDIQWLDPEGPHAVENIDEVAYHAIRMELKREQRA